MIVEGIVRAMRSVVGYLVQLLGTAEPPAWIASAFAGLTTVAGYGASMGSWVPWPVFGYALAAVVAALALSLTVRVVRIALSLFTGGGGSAA